MRALTARRSVAAVSVGLAAVVGVAVYLHPWEREPRLPWKAAEMLGEGEEGEHEVDKQMSTQGGPDTANSEAFEALTGAEQRAELRTAPLGIVPPGGYSAAYGQVTGLSTKGGAWTHVTGLPYDADDPAYRDYYSNSSGGSGLVTGIVTGLAADKSGYVYAANGSGGVFRSSTGGKNWTPIADALPALTSGTVVLDGSGALWYATGEASTSADSAVGSGVYRLANPRTGTFSPSDRVGGTELESSTIGELRFSGSTVWAATSRGVYTHSATSTSGSWTLRFAPNPSYLPGGANAGAANAAYKNIVNDVAIDPRNPAHVIAAAGWRSGDTYNGFYESNDGGSTWALINPGGAINPKDIGKATFAFSADGSKLYVVNESPTLLNKATGTVNSYLDGIYVSNTGNPAGPWNKIADTTKLANSGSALKAAVSGKGYGPGIQSWYNQFLVVDPADANHVYAGLEEVYETTNGGSTWTTPGPYWNFYFSCWSPTVLYPPNGTGACPQTTHPDQHAAAIGTVGGKPYLFVGNDGGVFRRPVSGVANANGNATDWESLNDGTNDGLQYYALGVGRDPANAKGVIVSGGLQDNGGSILKTGAAKMSSNFGGDGGDVYVDPTNGCNIVQEYVYLAMRVTQNCASPSDPNALVDQTKATTYDIAPPDNATAAARFIAPFAADDANPNNWLAGGNSLWFQTKGFAIRKGSEWQKVKTFGAGQYTTAIGYSGGSAVAGWCGPCNNSGFKRGISVGTVSGSTWTWKDLDLTALGMPNRYVAAAAVDPKNPKHLVVGFGGFNRSWTEGPGAKIAHLFESTDGGTTWANADANLPDAPVTTISILPSGGVVVGSDLAVTYRAAGASTWQRLGTGLPIVNMSDVEEGPDGYLYLSTYGRGIWKIPAAGL